MIYTKTFNSDGNLSQIDKVNVDSAAVENEITYAEYICMLAGIRIFLGKESVEKIKKELFSGVV